MSEGCELFDICKELALSGPSAENTRRMHEVLVVCCAAGSRGQGGGFGNMFSQVDYICKQRGIGASDRIAIQRMRRHARGATDDEGTDAQTDWLRDVRALARFISAVYGEGIPGDLLKLLPKEDGEEGLRQSRNGQNRRKHVRCIVRHWDEMFITAETDEGEVRVDYGNTEHGRDLGYVKKLLREGMQLNLLDCNVMDDGVFLPRLIIVEPDFLLDISSVAACFTAYGHHPLLYTLNRLKERPNTQAILLGNFAGTALELSVECSSQAKRPVGPSVEIRDFSSANEKRADDQMLKRALRRSFREDLLKFCTCEGFHAERFKREATEQLRNIQEALEVLFPADDKGRERGSDVLLEASFVCERLGLQGRVDLMTSDMRLLVEQKAGRNMKIERGSHDEHGWQQESHYVQLLLYYGILRYNFGRSDTQVDTRLMYSRYPAKEGLLSVNYYRGLFNEAIRLRNQIVATELLIAREGFGRIIPLLTPYYIYKGVEPDGYFTEYVLPQLQELQLQTERLTPLERAYYERMMTFVYREQLYQKLGNNATRLYHSYGAASDLWLMPLAEKLSTGNIICGLDIEKAEKSDEEGGYDLITLRGTLGTLNFRRGDMVYLYRYADKAKGTADGIPDVRSAILYKGTLERLEPQRLTVRLTNGQQSGKLFEAKKGMCWAVEHGSSDVTFGSNIRSMQQFANALPDRRALLLGQRAPQRDSTLRLSRTYSKTYDAILERAKQARDYFLLVGPPGTGKTSQALRFLVDEELTSAPTDGAKKPSILLTAYTNRAVDEICAMLEGEGWPYLRIGNRSSCDERFCDHLLEAALEKFTKLEDIRQYIQEMPIIVGTTSTLQSRQELLDLKRFSLCIVDEASQILEPNIIGLLAHPHIGRFILIGDYKQLPAVVSCDEHASKVEEPLLRAIGLTDCRQSLFERLIRQEQQAGRTQFIGTLNHQGRMHPEVAQFACSHFYLQEQLQPVPLPHQQESGPLYQLSPVDALDCRLLNERTLFIPSTIETEAALAAQIVERIHRFTSDTFSTSQTIGIIVTYRSQIAPIRAAISQLNTEGLDGISIDTVERYQGSQRDVIIYATGVSHRYQMNFLTANTFDENGHPIDRKLNVAITRARRQLIITGEPEILKTNVLFRELISTIS